MSISGARLTTLAESPPHFSVPPSHLVIKAVSLYHFTELCPLMRLAIDRRYAVILKYVQKLFDLPPFKRWNLINSPPKRELDLMIQF